VGLLLLHAERRSAAVQAAVDQIPPLHPELVIATGCDRVPGRV
jgi:hypothetical protein